MSKEEKSSGSKLLKSSFGAAFATLLSRILGLLRVRMEAAVLGGGSFASAWFLAFMIPNLFRRLLGEGALGTALIPLIAESDKEGGRELVRKNLAVVLTVLGAVLIVIVILVSMLSIATVYFDGWGIAFFQKDYIRKRLY